MAFSLGKTSASRVLPYLHHGIQLLLVAFACFGWCDNTPSSGMHGSLQILDQMIDLTTPHEYNKSTRG